MPFMTTNPATGEVEKTFPEHSPAEVEARLARAAATFAAFRRTSFAERARLMTTAAELLEGEIPDVARILTTEMGKTFASAKGEAAKCAMALRWFAEHAEALLADEVIETSARRSLVRHAVLEALRMAAITPSRAVELLHGQVSLADLPADDEADDEP